MDEVRITTSNRAALEVLKTIGLGDFALFREAVLRRELTGEIAYVNQRDHSSHTLYNYLLGWYFFIQSGRLKKALAEEFNKRGVPDSTFPFTDYSTYFGCIWQYVSLLHDIGYMFEGGPIKAVVRFQQASPSWRERRPGILQQISFARL